MSGDALGRFARGNCGGPGQCLCTPAVNAPPRTPQVNEDDTQKAARRLTEEAAATWLSTVSQPMLERIVGKKSYYFMICRNYLSGEGCWLLKQNRRQTTIHREWDPTFASNSGLWCV
ncbi:MAG TPA: hypothetical protein VGY58_10830 [Gemmataceae bacterium]|nr:hypothetical protein [Gemmataceae bacterium]